MNYVNLFLFAFSLLVFIGCEKANSDQPYEATDVNMDAVQTRPSSSDSYKYYSNVALFYDQSDSEVYFLRYDSLPSTQIQLDEIEVLGKYDNPVRLEIKDLKTNTTHQIGLSTDIYGIGLIDGASSVQAILEGVTDF